MKAGDHVVNAANGFMRGADGAVCDEEGNVLKLYKVLHLWDCSVEVKGPFSLSFMTTMGFALVCALGDASHPAVRLRKDLKTFEEAERISKLAGT